MRSLLTLSLLALLAASACARTSDDTLLNPQEARADLERLYTGLQSANADLFALTPRDVFEARFAELHASYDEPVTRAQFHRDAQRFAALARQAHTRIEGLNPDWPALVAAGGPVFPLRFGVHAGEVIVTAAPQDSGVVAGDRLLSLDGEPNPVWLARLVRNIAAETPAFAYGQLSLGEPYYIWLEYGAPESFDVEIGRDGERLSLTLNAISLQALSALEPAQAAFSLAGREARMLTPQIAYLRPGDFYNIEAETSADQYDPQALAVYRGFIDGAFEGFIASGATDLVLDLRDNGGGDASFSDPVVAWFADRPFRFASDFRVRVSPETIAANQAQLEAMEDATGSMRERYAEIFARHEAGEMVSIDLPYTQPREGQRFEGRVHVLVNRNSYSNAVTVAALIQDYGFGTVYGETTLDMATTYGAMEHFTLPHSGFLVAYPKALIVRPGGVEHPHPLQPDVTLPAPAVRGEADLMLDALLDRLAD
ncbi:MAG: S41 family peptidase [Caulobacterales bacterium]|uniref:S41 family peptidase n=1 Tax=Glycocaulis sp. TaxID=1969725 RepID=UPI003F9FA092